MDQINHPDSGMQGVSLTILKEQFALQKDNFFLWSPVFLGLGIGLYFTLLFEPPLWVGMLAFTGTLGLLAFGLRFRDHALRPVYFLKLALVIITGGFLIAQLRTAYVDAPILERKIAFAKIEGIVESVEPLEEGGGSRIIVKNSTVEKLPANKTPYRIRLRLRADQTVLVGQHIKVMAELNPPSGPVIPGGFDFRRHLYFSGIGAVGFVYKAPEILKKPESIFSFSIESLRQAIGARIEKALAPREASVSLALMIGQQRALSEEDMQAIRNAGLAHMLSISGLHITLFAGVLFFLSRLLMATIPNFAIKHPIKKYAAVIGIAAALFYMLLAGSTAPTIRSVLMTGVIFFAVILDRSPISLRLVAFAALVILLFQPENLISVSFQMSFAAVASLIAFFEGTREFWMRWNREAGLVRKSGLYLASICLTTFIATLSTTPFSVYHFQQFAFMGVVANFIAVPLLSFFIMPFIVLAFFLMLVGLETYALFFVGIGVDWILDISYWASNLPHAVMLFPAWPFSSFLLCVIAGLWIILWKGWGKILAALPLIISAIFISQNHLPDILVSETHKLFGFKVDNTLYVSTRKSDKFALENWQKLYGLRYGETLLIDDKTSPFSCDPAGCRITVKEKNISYMIDPYEVRNDCAWADIMLSVEPMNKRKCKASLIVDKFDTWRSGSLAIWINDDGTTIHKTAANMTGTRPWAKVIKPKKPKINDTSE